MKECFGNYMEEKCQGGFCTCTEEGCFEKTNLEIGICNCEYKQYCHVPRQKMQESIRAMSIEPQNENCFFFKYFKAKLAQSK